MTDASISLIGIDLPGRRLGAGGRNRGRLGTSAAWRLPGAAVWALCPLLAIPALPLPPFLLLALMFAAACLTRAAAGLVRGDAIVDLDALRSGEVGRRLVGMVLAGVCLLLALRLVLPVPEAWPVLGPVLAALTGLEAAGPEVTTLADAGRLAVVLALLLGAGTGGLLLAIGGPLSPGSGRRRDGLGPARGIALYGLAGLACLFLHLCLEPRSVHEAGAILAAVAIGVGPLGLGALSRGRAGGLSAAQRRGAGGR